MDLFVFVGVIVGARAPCRWCPGALSLCLPAETFVLLAALPPPGVLPRASFVLAAPVLSPACHHTRL